MSHFACRIIGHRWSDYHLPNHVRTCWRCGLREVHRYAAAFPDDWPHGNECTCAFCRSCAIGGGA